MANSIQERMEKVYLERHAAIVARQLRNLDALERDEVRKIESGITGFDSQPTKRTIIIYPHEIDYAPLQKEVVEELKRRGYGLAPAFGAFGESWRLTIQIPQKTEQE